MVHNKFWRIAALLVILAMVLVACGGAPTAEPPAVEEPAAEEPAAEEPAAEPTEAPAAEEPVAEETGGFEIPTVEEGKFNIAAVLIGPHDDGGFPFNFNILGK